MQTSKPYTTNYRQILPVQWINKDLWRWFRSHVILQDDSTGEIINELIYQYRHDAVRSNVKLNRTSPFEPDQESQLSIRGIDRELWRWFRSQAVLENDSPGKILNELIYRYRKEMERI